MGMFDILKINTEMLPISECDKRTLGSSPKWQTKDFDCIMSVAEITDSGKLKFRRFNYGWDANAECAMTKISGRKGALTEENVRWVELSEYHGIVNFYTCDNYGNWWEFNAKFSDGELVEITGGNKS